VNQLINSPDTGICVEFKDSLQTLEQPPQESKLILHQRKSNATYTTCLPVPHLQQQIVFPLSLAHQATAFKKIEYKPFYLSNFSNSPILKKITHFSLVHFPHSAE